MNLNLPDHTDKWKMQGTRRKIIAFQLGRDKFEIRPRNDYETINDPQTNNDT